MNHQELLDTATDCAGYFVSNSDSSASHASISGYTIDDLAMDTVEYILSHNVPLDNLAKRYVLLVTRSITLNIKRKHQLTLSNVLPEDLIPLDTVDSVLSELSSSLPDTMHALFDLSMIQGKTDAEAGDILGVSDRHIRRLMVPVKAAVKEYLVTEGTPNGN